MRSAVLDENVIMLALESDQNPSEQLLAAADVVAEVQERHRWVLSDQIIATYESRIYHAPYKGQVWRRILGSFYNALVDPDRQLRLLDPPEIAGAYHQKDRPWIAAAAAAPADCCLITMDGRLIGAIIAAELDATHEFELCDIDDGLDLLRREA